MTGLRAALADYLALRRALGYRLAVHERLLGQFLDFLEANDAEVEAIMAAARSLRSPLLAHTYEALIGLLAVSGLFSAGQTGTNGTS